MSEPIRYKATSDCFFLKSPDFEYFYEAKPDEVFVKEADYARLKAEVDEYRKDVTASVDTLIDERNRLKAEVERLDTLCKQLMNQHSDISCENIMLRKAGDELLDGWIGMYGDHKGSMAQDYIKLWNAAKEGKPTK